MTGASGQRVRFGVAEWVAVIAVIGTMITASVAGTYRFSMDVNAVRSDVDDMKTELKTEMAGMKSDLTTVKDEVRRIRDREDRRVGS